MSEIADQEHMDRLASGVEELGTVIGSVEALVSNIVNELREAKLDDGTDEGYDTSKVDAIAETLKDYSDRLSAMVVANTPSKEEPAPQPEPEPTPEPEPEPVTEPAPEFEAPIEEPKTDENA